jgi:hypothetical protein
VRSPLGHPLGCTGAKLTATILRDMARRKSRIRHGHDVRRRRTGRRWNLRMAAIKGGSFLCRGAPARRRLHPGGSHRRASGHRPHGRRVLGQGSGPASRRAAAAHEPGVALTMLRKSAELGLTAITVPRSIRRNGAGSRVRHRRGGASGADAS